MCSWLGLWTVAGWWSVRAGGRVGGMPVVEWVGRGALHSPWRSARGRRGPGHAFWGRRASPHRPQPLRVPDPDSEFLFFGGREIQSDIRRRSRGAAGRGSGSWLVVGAGGRWRAGGVSARAGGLEACLSSSGWGAEHSTALGEAHGGAVGQGMLCGGGALLHTAHSPCGYRSPDFYFLVGDRENDIRRRSRGAPQRGRVGVGVGLVVGAGGRWRAGGVSARAGGLEACLSSSGWGAEHSTALGEAHGGAVGQGMPLGAARFSTPPTAPAGAGSRL